MHLFSEIAMAQVNPQSIDSSTAARL